MKKLSKMLQAKYFLGKGKHNGYVTGLFALKSEFYVFFYLPLCNQLAT